LTTEFFRTPRSVSMFVPSAVPERDGFALVKRAYIGSDLLGTPDPNVKDRDAGDLHRPRPDPKVPDENDARRVQARGLHADARPRRIGRRSRA